MAAVVAPPSPQPKADTTLYKPEAVWGRETDLVKLVKLTFRLLHSGSSVALHSFYDIG